MSTYIVTGGAGFIGSHLVEKLLNDGHKVIVIDDLSTGFKEYLPEHDNLEFYPIGIHIYNLLKIFSSEFGDVDGVFHLAAEARIQPAIQNPELAHKSNVTGTFNVLQMMRELNIKNIVYSCSSSSYGLKNGTPNVETQTPDPLNAYAATKLMGEIYCKTWGQSYGINNVCLKYFNVYGERSPLDGQYAPVIGIFFRQGINGEPLTIVGDGWQLRDMTYVSDVVDANILAMQKIENGITDNISGETFNIGTGFNYHINRVAELIISNLRAHTGISPHTTSIPERPGEARVTRADISKAQKYLHWSPKVSLVEKLRDLTPYYIELLK